MEEGPAVRGGVEATDGNSACILCRSQLEALIDVSYLYLCKKINNTEEERERWLEFDYISKSSIYTKWKEFEIHNKLGVHASIKFTEKEIKTAKYFDDKRLEFKEKYKGGNWAFDRYAALDKRARAIDNSGFFNDDFGVSIILEEAYIFFYKWSSEFTHAESGSMTGYITGSDHETRPRLEIGPSLSNVDTAAPIAIQMLMVLCYLINKIHHLNINIQKELDDRGYTIRSKE